jgi:hypothetical protein
MRTCASMHAFPYSSVEAFLDMALYTACDSDSLVVRERNRGLCKKLWYFVCIRATVLGKKEAGENGQYNGAPE